MASFSRWMSKLFRIEDWVYRVVAGNVEVFLEGTYKWCTE